MLSSYLVYKFGDFIYGTRNGVLVIFLTLQVLTLNTLSIMHLRQLRPFKGMFQSKEEEKIITHNA